MMQTNSLDTSSADGLRDAIPFPYDVRFVDCETSPAIRSLIEDQLGRITHFYDRITSARVNVRIPHKHGGVRYFHIHVQLEVPGRRLAVSREPEANEKHTDIKLAIRDAFQKMTRQLEDFVKYRNGHKGERVERINGIA